MYGSDQSALEANGMRELVNRIKNVQPVIGDGIKKIVDRETEVATKLRYWEER